MIAKVTNKWKKPKEREKIRNKSLAQTHRRKPIDQPFTIAIANNLCLLLFGVCVCLCAACTQWTFAIIKLKWYIYSLNAVYCNACYATPEWQVLDDKYFIFTSLQLRFYWLFFPEKFPAVNCLFHRFLNLRAKSSIWMSNYWIFNNLYDWCHIAWFYILKHQ